MKKDILSAFPRCAAHGLCLFPIFTAGLVKIPKDGETSVLSLKSECSFLKNYLCFMYIGYLPWMMGPLELEL